MGLGLQLLVLLWVFPTALVMPVPETEQESRGQREDRAPQTLLKELLQSQVKRETQSQDQIGPRPDQNHKTIIRIKQNSGSGCFLSTCVQHSLPYRIFTLNQDRDKKLCAPRKKMEQIGRRRRALDCLEGAPEMEGPEREGPEIEEPVREEPECEGQGTKSPGAIIEADAMFV